MMILAAALAALIALVRVFAEPGSLDGVSGQARGARRHSADR